MVFSLVCVSSGLIVKLKGCDKKIDYIHLTHRQGSSAMQKGGFYSSIKLCEFCII